MFENIYKGKKVIVTGHTGFKGSWLITWLLKLGANVCGISKDVPTVPSMFVDNNLEEKIDHYIIDVRDLGKVKKVIVEFEPDYIFHLAAQAIVSESYDNPVDTITTNIVGTTNILESMKEIENDCVGVIITSDKCYENVEWEWGYKESDQLGGKDIYSASKGGAELIFHAYHESFLKKKPNIRLVSCRAGNVIGGGDWAKDRIIVDCVKSWQEIASVVIRSPNSTRPWQHVLEPLSGYLTIGHALTISDKLDGESFNFGPKPERNKTVIDVINDFSREYKPSVDFLYKIEDEVKFNEAGLLKLNCDKAIFHLKWEATLYYDECIHMIAQWYKKYAEKGADLHDVTVEQISIYEERAESRDIVWAK